MDTFQICGSNVLEQRVMSINVSKQRSGLVTCFYLLRFDLTSKKHWKAQTQSQAQESCLDYPHLHSFTCIMRRRRPGGDRKGKCLTKPNGGNEIKISAEKGLHNRIPRQISCAVELLMSICNVDANVCLT